MTEKHVTLDEFMENVKPGGVVGRKSMLDDYADEIKTLRKRRYTIDQICEYLQQAHGLEAKRATVATYLNRKLKQSRRKADARPENQADAHHTEPTPEPKTPSKTRKADIESGADEFLDN